MKDFILFIGFVALCWLGFFWTCILLKQAGSMIEAIRRARREAKQ